MKQAAQDVLAKLRQKVEGRATPPATGEPPVAADQLEPPWAAKLAGETVFADRATRFRSLTVTEADLSALEAPEGFHEGFKIRVAKLGGRRREAGKLVERRYRERGYALKGLTADPQLSTFLAYDEGLLLGTVSVRLDSVKGLAADELYRGELDALRAAGARMCEFTRLAIDKTAASKPVLAGLFHTAHLYASVIRGFTHAVMEVHPRHVVFYGQALRFDPIGTERMNNRVHAPAVLLCAPFATIADGIAKYAGKPEVPAARRSLFTYGFPPQDAVGVLGRLRDLVMPR